MLNPCPKFGRETVDSFLLLHEKCRLTGKFVNQSWVKKNHEICRLVMKKKNNEFNQSDAEEKLTKFVNQLGEIITKFVTHSLEMTKFGNRSHEYIAKFISRSQKKNCQIFQLDAG